MHGFPRSGSSNTSGKSKMDANAVQRYLMSLQITPNAVVQNAVNTPHLGETVVTLIRGGSQDGCMRAMNQMSAGGQPPNPNCGRPSNDQAVSQVGGSQVGRPQQKLPEFTANIRKSMNWARRGGWLVVKIKAKYLTLGDVGQSGWVCFHNAPLQWAQFVPHPDPITGRVLNAD